MNKPTRTTLALAILAVGVVASLGTAGTASAASAPGIESESVANVTATDATLEAQVNVQESGDAYAQFQLVEEPSEYATKILCPPATSLPCIGNHSDGALPIAFLPANTEQPEAFDSASLNLASAGVALKPGTTYHFRVVAAPMVQTEDTIQWEGPTAFGADQTFTTPTAGAPLIEGESVSHIAATDATLEAEINSEGLETTYEFHLITAPPCSSGECPQHVFSLASGKLLGSFQTQSVSLDLSSAGVRLTPGERYEYWVTVSNSAGTAGEEIPGRNVFTASAEEPPSVLHEGVSNVTSTDAILEATIEPRGGRNAFYQFQLVKDPSEYPAEILCPPGPWPGYSACVGMRSVNALPIGSVCGECEIEPAAMAVHLDLASAGLTLEPDTTYHFRVLAARAIQTEDTIQWEQPTVFGSDQTFTTQSDPQVDPEPPLGQGGSSAGGQALSTTQLPSSPASSSHHRRHGHRRRHRRRHRRGRGNH